MTETSIETPLLILENEWAADQIRNEPDSLLGAAVRSVTPTGVGATGASYRLDTLPYNVKARRRYIGSIYGQPIATDPATGDQYTVNWRDDDHPWLAVRDVSDEVWRDVFDLTTIPGNPFGLLVDDSHNTMSVAVHEGVIHVMGNMHTVGMKYARTDATGAPSTFTAASFGSDVATFNSVTYPQLFIVAGFLFAIWRNGNSSSGKMMLKRFDRGSLTWAAATVIADGDLSGEGPYPSKPLIYEAEGVAKFGFFTTWRTDSTAGSNNGFTFIETADLGVTWRRVDGTAQAMPMTRANSVDVYPVSTGSGFVNQCGGTYDDDGHPHGFLTLYDGAGNTQYYSRHWTGSAWATEQLTHFTSRVDTSTNTLYLSTSRPDGFRAGGRVYLVGKTLFDGKDGRPLLLDATPGADHAPVALADLDLAGWEPSCIDHVGVQQFRRLNLFLCSVDQVADSELNWDRQWAGLMSIATDALPAFIRQQVVVPTIKPALGGAQWDMPVTAVGGTADASVESKLPRGLVPAGRAYAKGTRLMVRLVARVSLESGTTTASLYLRAAPSAGSQTSVDLCKLTIPNSTLQGQFATPWEPLPLYVETDGTRRDTVLTPRAIADNAAGVRVEGYEIQVGYLATP